METQTGSQTGAASRPGGEAALAGEAPSFIPHADTAETALASTGGYVLTPDHRNRLIELAARFGGLSPTQLKSIRRAGDKAAQHWDFNAPGAALDEALVRLGKPANVHNRIGLIATLALTLPDHLAEMALPASVLELYPRATEMMVTSLEDEAAYEDDFYAKDARFVLGQSVPAGAQFVDLYSRLGPKLVLRQIARREGLSVARRYIAAKGNRPWLQIHTDPRDTKDFNEEGWDRCYVRIADLLERDPSMAGVLGTTWFYDPALLTISPRLAYLQKPVEHGAFRLWIGSSPLDVERAGATSPTRKAMIEAGTYKPTSFIIAWPREALLKWATQQA